MCLCFRSRRSSTWYWELAVRARVLALTVLPIIAPKDGIATASAILLALVSFAWADIKTKPYAYLRNNTISQMCNYMLILLLFAGMAFTAGPTQGTREAIFTVTTICMTITFALLVHAVLFEILYYSKERLAGFGVMTWLLDTRFMQVVFSTDRSYLSDFKQGLATRGECVLLVSKPDCLKLTLNTFSFTSIHQSTGAMTSRSYPRTKIMRTQEPLSMRCFCSTRPIAGRRSTT